MVLSNAFCVEIPRMLTEARSWPERFPQPDHMFFLPLRVARRVRLTDHLCDIPPIIVSSFAIANRF
jgi:hypothetical protein